MFDPKALTELRSEAGVSRPQLARYLDVERVQIWRWETGKTVPERGTVYVLPIVLAGLTGRPWEETLQLLMGGNNE